VSVYHYDKAYESPGKIAVRAATYAAIPRKKLYEGYHVVISSRECGDIKFLLGIGISPTKIIACDVDARARSAARKLGVVVSPFNDIVDTTFWAAIKYKSKNIATVNVDLCMCLIRGTAILTKVLSRGLHPDTQVMFTYAVGRDSMHSNKERLAYFREQTPQGIKNHYYYQSFTKDSVGCPMSTLTL
jgi:hypothetical protein